MKKQKYTLLGLVLVVMLFCGCGTAKESNLYKQQVIENINQLEIESGVEVEMSLSEFTPFEWEKVYFFKPYTSKESIKEVIGCKIKDYYYSASDSDSQIYFINDGKVVCSLTGNYDALQFRVDYNFDDIYYQLDNEADITITNEDGVRILKVAP